MNSEMILYEHSCSDGHMFSNREITHQCKCGKCEKSAKVINICKFFLGYTITCANGHIYSSADVPKRCGFCNYSSIRVSEHKNTL